MVMPVQINEVIIRAVVDSKKKEDGDKDDDKSLPSGTVGPEVDIVEKIFEIIRQKQER